MKGKKSGGRQKGTPNKITKDIRQHFKTFIDDNFDDFIDAWEIIKDPKEKAEIYLKAAKFVVPSLQSVNFQSIDEKDNTVEKYLQSLSEELNHKP